LEAEEINSNLDQIVEEAFENGSLFFCLEMDVIAKHSKTTGNFA
jgi:hypothetical protein